MSMMCWGNNTDRRNLKSLGGGTILHYYFLHHKSHINTLGTWAFVLRILVVTLAIMKEVFLRDLYLYGRIILYENENIVVFSIQTLSMHESK